MSRCTVQDTRYWFGTSVKLFTFVLQAQYTFNHDALEELITCGKTEISAVNLRIAMNRLSAPDQTTGLTGFQKQFEVLVELKMML